MYNSTIQASSVQLYNINFPCTTIQYKLRGHICFSPRPSRNRAKGELSETFPIHNAPPPPLNVFPSPLALQLSNQPPPLHTPPLQSLCPLLQKVHRKAAYDSFTSRKAKEKGGTFYNGFLNPPSSEKEKIHGPEGWGTSPSLVQ